MRRVLNQGLVHGLQKVDLEGGAMILTAMASLAFESGAPFLFYECDDEDRTEQRTILVAKDDEELPPFNEFTLKWIASIQNPMAMEMLHIFEVIEKYIAK